MMGLLLGAGVLAVAVYLATKKTETVVNNPAMMLDMKGVNSNPKGGAAVSGCATNPNFQWQVTAGSGSTAASISLETFGVGGANLVTIGEIVRVNAPVYGTKGNSNDLTYDFGADVSGKPVLLPKTWNSFIDQTGVRTPGTKFPTC